MSIVTYLDESDPDLHLTCLEIIQPLIPTQWPEFANRLPQIESLSENTSFEGSRLAALIASKIHYELNSYDDAVTFALKARDLFDPSEDSLYSQTIVAECVQKWISQCQEAVDSQSSATCDELSINADLLSIVNNSFESAFNHPSDFSICSNAIGIALDGRSISYLQHVLEVADPSIKGKLLEFTLDMSEHVSNSIFRIQVLRIIADLHITHVAENGTSDISAYFSAARCAFILGDSALMSVLLQLSLDNPLTGFQLCIDLAETATPQFISLLLTEVSDPIQRSILSSFPITKNRLKFLHSRCAADMELMRAVRDSFEPRNSQLLSSAFITNAFMHSGTTVDTFLRRNLEWMSGATFYSKFVASAGLGAVHYSHREKGRNVLNKFLPSEVITSKVDDPYALGGGCFGLGLVYSEKGAGSAEIVNYLQQTLKQVLALPDQLSFHEPLIHGASLGLGLASWGSGDTILSDSSSCHVTLELLKSILFTDLTVGCEAASLSLGLLAVGTINQSQELLELLLTISQDTKKPRVARNAVLAIALMSIGTEDQSNVVIRPLLESTDAVVRYGAVYALGCSYCATSNAQALSTLLSIASTDTNDDVRRASVTMIGLVLVKKPKDVLSVVSLSSRSHSPHLRYGAAMAVGIAFAATGDVDAINLLYDLSRDSVDFVRQGAFIALGLVLQTTSLMSTPKHSAIRKSIIEILGSKFEDDLVKSGCMIALGLMDCGGRNSFFSLVSPQGSGIFSGTLMAEKVVGLVVFLQHWFWLPYALFYPLCNVPAGFIGVLPNENLEVPAFDLLVDGKPSSFDYPPKYQPPKKKTVSRAAAAVLSVSTKERVRQARLAKERQRERMEEGLTYEDPLEKAKERAAEQEELSKMKPEKEEPNSYTVANPCRCTLGQVNLIDVVDDCRFKPVLKSKKIGCVVLIDESPEEPFEPASFVRKEEEGGSTPPQPPAPALDTPQAMRQ
ncbi:hypothetical protein RCL1_000552 [Eukaryota sp. TZLM3-RCL]